MPVKSLPTEVLIQISKYIKDYKTLYSCILVSRQWCNINIPTLWRDPFHSDGSIKILINCLLLEDRDFLSRNNIELTFKLLDRPTLYNYAKFVTILEIPSTEDETLLYGYGKIYLLNRRLIEFVLDYSNAINVCSTFELECNGWLINHRRFDICFRDLSKLECDFSDNRKFFLKLAKNCKTIQSLIINNFYDNLDDGATIVNDSIAQLIEAQNQIKELTIQSSNYIILSANLLNAISKHSNSITCYKSDKKNNLSSLISTFRNLNRLALHYSYKKDFKILKSVLFPNLETVDLTFFRELCLIELVKIIKFNGKNLKHLAIRGNDELNLANLFHSIGENCKGLKYISIVYKNEFDQQLMELLKSCIKLEHIALPTFPKIRINVNNIFQILNQTLPKNLSCIDLGQRISISDNVDLVNSLDVLMKNWKGPKPLEYKLPPIYTPEIEQLDKILKKYQDLGFINRIP